MRLLPGPAALLCTEHGSCYTRATIGRHLTERHAVKGAAKKGILAWMDLVLETLTGDRLTGEGRRPPHGAEPIHGLPIHSGYQCRYSGGVEQGPSSKLGRCGLLTTSLDRLRKHLSEAHGLKRFVERRRRQGAEMGENPERQQVDLSYREVQLQTLWAETRQVDYFIIRERKSQDSRRRGKTGDIDSSSGSGRDTS